MTGTGDGVMKSTSRRRGFRHTSATRPTADGSVVDAIARMLSSGFGIDACARRLGLPRDFVAMVARHTADTGRSPTPPTTDDASAPCSWGSCSPDPGSLICAGCPLSPPSSRSSDVTRRWFRSVLALLRKAVSSLRRAS
ncbi:hypothetical protein [Bifidobacterium minimum]|uniref:hypothetical protein n=1 Tax=Bifidobacterium minimum TaxID=1693 RepID=UPI0003B35113|nr:hypothetical protein [Bifidobacterium minimum]